ncbi:MAG: hypothetical protein A2079_03220 [Geobacteraceae bacterium GWC2_48_7]|nr:MAG: hypothetical protein A2079_03220 [Geobacteraceae bacterium GWC2_48_7]
MSLLQNYCGAGLRRCRSLKSSKYILVRFGTFFGILPGGFVYVNAGASPATIDSTSDVASPRVLGSFALLGLFALIPVLYSKIKNPK